MSTAVQFAQHLQSLIRRLGIRHTFETSFKLRRGALDDHRFLYGLRNARLGNRPEQTLLRLCAELGMPAHLLADYRAQLPRSRYVHFGFEQQDDTCIYKAYLEFYESVMEELRGAHDGGPRLMYLGYKWSAADSAVAVITRYDWFPELSSEEIGVRSAALLSPAPALQASLQSILARAQSEFPERRLHYMEIHEADNPRRSLDINFYSTGLQVAQIEQQLAALADDLGVPAQRFSAAMKAAAAAKLGHIACGINRDGAHFASVYHGVRTLAAA
jgi:tryptophan halogenase